MFFYSLPSARSTTSGVIGTRVSRAPKGLSASLTALSTAPGAPATPNPRPPHSRSPQVSPSLDETRRAERVRQGAEARGLTRGTRWRLRRRWANLDWEKRQTLRDLFTLNRRLAKAYLLKEQLAQLRTYTDEGAARRFLTNPLLALRWQRLPAFQKLGRMLTLHLDGILSYCHENAPFGTVETINGNIRAMLRWGRGYRDYEYLLLKVQKATASRRLCQTA